ncbi:MAG: toxin-antitoxin system YwqK family antitoxin [Cytophagales bacterium]|nr:toxin-antitoxin system YwqK family antitoxin [Cytophagales bacterium]
MSPLKCISALFLLMMLSCTDGVSSYETSGESSIPKGAVVHPYDDLPGRSRVMLYQNGKIIGEGDYLNGQPEGAWTEYDPQSNVVVKVTNYLGGKKHGVELVFDGRNGQLKSKQTYYQDVLHGQLLTFKSRKVEEEKNYASGQLEGMARKFYPNGSVLEEAPYSNGVIHGTAKWFDESGNLTIQYEYENGQFISDTTPPKTEGE